MPAPPLPFLSPEHHGRLVIFAFMAFAGDAAAAQRALSPFRSLATPLADMVKPGPYLAMYPPEDPSYKPTAVAQTGFVQRVDLDDARVIYDYLAKSEATMRVAQIRALGGAMAAVPDDATAFAHRSKAMLINIAAFYKGADERRARRKWVTEFWNALDPRDNGAYVGFLTDDGEARIRSAYPGKTWDRLARIKKKYDPTNLFRLNQNIRAG
jgi:hypothetical protein